MIVETRIRGREKSLVLIPTPEEAKLVDEVLGSRVKNDDGLIAEVVGEFRIADGYGPCYITLRVKPEEAEPREFEEPE
jgi:hypothetical protein